MSIRVVSYATNEDDQVTELVDVWDEIPAPDAERVLDEDVEIAAQVAGQDPEPGNVWLRTLHSVVPEGYAVDAELTGEDWVEYRNANPDFFAA